MLLIRMMRYLRGYHVLSAEGFFLERFLNIAAQKGVVLWDIGKRNGAVFVSLYKKDLPAMEQAAEVAGISVKPVASQGVPFLIRRYGRRKGFLLGLVVFLGLLWFFSSFIWSVSVTGNKDVPSSEILGRLKELGVAPGSFIPGINVSRISNEMLLSMPSLSWIAINIKGSRANVEVREKIPAPEMVPVNQPCNIVAARAGQIISVEAYEGTAMVKPGDAVTEGQLLVSGVMDSSVEGIRLVHASARVMARTYREITVETPLSSVERLPTGRKTRRISLEILGLRINLFLNSGVEYRNYDKITEENSIRLSRDVVLPVSFTVTEYSEVSLVTRTVDADTALRSAREELGQIEAELFTGKPVLSREVDEKVLDKTVVLAARYECSEDIALEQAFESSLDTR